MSENSYPLIYARVGSIIKDGSVLARNVISKPITLFFRGGEGKTSMSGQSQFAHSSTMNQGSVGLSGSYGVSGVSRLSGSVSGYLGNSTADSGKSVVVNYNAYISAGIELLNVDELSLIDFVTSLAKNPQKDLLAVLEKYTALVEGVKANPTAEDVINNKQLFQDWGKSIANFQKNYGTGLVVGVHWGGFGSVSMDITSAGEGSSWNYGGEAEFTYAGTGASASVKATYSGGQSTSDSDVSIKVNSSFKGDCIQPLINEWRKQAEGKAFKELAEVEMLAKVPSLSVPSNIKASVPEFVKPKGKKDESIASKFGEIKSLKSLEAFATAQAFDQAKKEDMDLTLDNFLRQKNEPANIEVLDTLGNLNNLPDNEEENSNTTSESDSDDTSLLRRSEQFYHSKMITTQAGSSDYLKEFVPLGILIHNWSDIFPWLARGYNNDIGNIGESLEILKWRSMIQDFQTLSILYFTADSIGLPLGEGSSAVGMANQFKKASVILQAIKEEDSYAKNMKDAIFNLTTLGKKIYEIWSKNSVLRSGELGMGVYYHKEKTSIASMKKSKSLNFANPEKYPLYLPVLKSIDFEGDPSAFSSYSKVFPIISFNEEINVFTDKGFFGTIPVVPNISSVKEGDRFFSPQKRGKTNWHITNFEINEIENCLEDGDVKLHPIPYKAAEGITWEGGAVGAASLSSFDQLNETIGNLRKELGRLKSWSLSSDSYEGIDKKLIDLALTDIQVDASYLGMIPEQADLMRQR